MSFLFRNNSNNNQIPNADVPKGVNMKFTNLNKPKEGVNEGYNNQKLNDTLENKTRSKITKNGRPGAGWEDEDNDSNNLDQNITQNNGNKSGMFSSNITKQTNAIKSSTSNSNSNGNNENKLYSLESLQNIEHEINIISEVIQPQGARVKPQDNLLASFGKACEVLKTEIVGSILLSNLMIEEIQWLILMKTLYAIEFLIKNHAKYFKYFQIHKNILNNLIMPKDENQASQAAVINNKIIAILENQTKNEKVYHDKLMIENLAIIQENKAKDLLDLGGNQESDSQKKKFNAFDVFINNNKSQTPNQSQYENKQQSNNLLQTQNLDILGSDNLINNNNFLKNETLEQENEKKNKGFSFLKKKPAEKIEQINKETPSKQIKFDPFAISTQQKAQQNIENENKKKAFSFIKKEQTDNNSLLSMNINLEENKQKPKLLNSNLPMATPAENKTNKIMNLQQNLAPMNVNTHNSVNIPHNLAMNTSNLQHPPLNLNNNIPHNMPMNPSQMQMNPSQMPMNFEPHNLNQNPKTPFDNLYNNYTVQPNINPVMMNFYYAQMNPGYMGMPMNMMSYPMNMMGSMTGTNMRNPGINMMNPGMNMMNLGMNMMGNIPPSEINKTPEKKEPKKVIDESAFDFIKLE